MELYHVCNQTFYPLVASLEGFLKLIVRMSMARFHTDIILNKMYPWQKEFILYRLEEYRQIFNFFRRKFITFDRN